MSAPTPTPTPTPTPAAATLEAREQRAFVRRYLSRETTRPGAVTRLGHLEAKGKVLYCAGTPVACLVHVSPHNVVLVDQPVCPGDLRGLIEEAAQACLTERMEVDSLLITDDDVDYPRQVDYTETVFVQTLAAVEACTGTGMHAADGLRELDRLERQAALLAALNPNKLTGLIHAAVKDTDGTPTGIARMLADLRRVACL